MPKRTDIHKILVIGSGPIQIGQACEFDYSGTQALRVLRSEGYEVVLVNSNPATIMTDPELSDRLYIEPLKVEYLERIIEKERPDAILPTLGGQVALNLTIELYDQGVLDTYDVEVLGAKIDTIQIAEDREKFKNMLLEKKLPVLESKVVRDLEEGMKVADQIGYPVILRPSFTLGGAGGGAAFNKTELREKLSEGLLASPTTEVLVEKSISGWKEIEFEVMRDQKNQMVVVCSIENLDPMGIHTGDSITVAPVQTLTDKEFQRLREASKVITEGVGIETGGCNIQYALDPESEAWVVVEMNPRVSRSSALASKATGFAIAKLAALLAVGYHLDELKNDITEVTPASFEPTLDYIVVKMPRFAFEKFQTTDPRLGTQMKSVGEVMSIGRTFKEAFQKAFNSMEIGHLGLGLPESWHSKEVALPLVTQNRFDRWWLIAELLRKKTHTIEEIYRATKIDRWFLTQLQEILDLEKQLSLTKLVSLERKDLLKAKAYGFANKTLATLLKTNLRSLESKIEKFKISPNLNQVDTCAGEFEAKTPYYYLAYEENQIDFAKPKQEALSSNPAVAILGSGPNRIGQGIEFDYCCVKAAQAAEELGYETVMLNCNPETVSTDYDLTDRLYFEPLEKEYVDQVLKREKNLKGVICQTGGQTPLRLSQELRGYPLLGTSSAQIDRAEDRGKFDQLLKKLKLMKPPSKSVAKFELLEATIHKFGYPVLIRPSYVLGGRSMYIIRSNNQLDHILTTLKSSTDIQWPILVDRFLENAIEVDVDCIGDGKDVITLAVMEHIEEAGVHSGDSSCTLPAITLEDSLITKVKQQSERIAKELKLCGFLNLQFAILKDKIYILEVNPRASRTIPFVCKATGFNWVRAATFAMLGETFKKQGLVAPPLRREDFPYVSVKQVVFPFLKFPGVDVLLGPEMKSTGEVMGVGEDFSEAFVKGLLASGHRLPRSGEVFVSVRDEDKERVLEICQKLKDLGFRIVATHGTKRFLRSKGIVVRGINKVKEGQPHIVDAIINGEIAMVVNTTDGEQAISDSYSIRRSALQAGVPYFTALTAARAAALALESWIRGSVKVKAIQDLPAIVQKDREKRARPASLNKKKAETSSSSSSSSAKKRVNRR